ncbi:MAG: prepilin-type N-terminal cleavage/methylation domain-containing protein [Rhodanobacteraceae bacterium]
MNRVNANLEATRRAYATRRRSRVPGPGSRLLRGFTLLEILLALVLMAFVMLGVWGALSGATRITRASDALMAQSEDVRTVQQFLRRYVSVARMQPWSTAGDTPRVRMFEGDATSMRYVAPLPMQSGHAGLYLQRVNLRRNADGRMTLWLEYQPYTAGVPATGEPLRHVLLTNLQGGKFEYLAAAAFGKPAGWRDDWTAPSGLPLAVRIHLDPAWRARVPFPDMVIRLHSGEGYAAMIGGAP